MGAEGGEGGRSWRARLHILPSVGLTYRLLLSSNSLTLSRMCGVLSTCRRRLERARHSAGHVQRPGGGDRASGAGRVRTSTGQESKIEAGIAVYNKYLLDLCNCLWRNRALPVTDQEAAMSFMPHVNADTNTESDTAHEGGGMAGSAAADALGGKGTAAAVGGGAASGGGARWEGAQSFLSLTSSLALSGFAAEFARTHMQSMAKATTGGLRPETFKSKHKVALLDYLEVCIYLWCTSQAYRGVSLRRCPRRAIGRPLLRDDNRRGAPFRCADGVKSCLHLCYSPGPRAAWFV